MKQDKKKHILTVASNLFYKQGIRATGIDQIVAESGVAKMTLYNHFPSKDELVIAYLTNRDQVWMDRFKQKVLLLGNTPERQLLAIFDVLEEWFKQPDFNGCAFINTASEFPENDHIYHQQSLEHKKLLKNFISLLVSQANVKENISLTNGLYLLVEGAIVTAMIHNDYTAARYARNAAQILINNLIHKEEF